MAKQGQRAEVNTFIQGLITEASPLNFPPNASKEEENFELFKDGTRRRRKGLDFEEGYTTINTLGAEILDNGFHTSYFEWDSVAGDPSLSFVVISFNNAFHVFDSSVEPLSSGYIGPVNATVFEGTSGVWQFASIEGRLVCVGNDRFITVVSYDAATNTLSAINDTIKVRDFWGIEEPDTYLESNDKYQPTDDYIQHRYNLQNQSWGVPRKNKTGAISDPIEIYHTEYGRYPSNSELVWPGLQFQAVQAGSDPYERIFPSLYQEVFGLGVSASKGYFIIDLLLRGDSRIEQFAKNYSDTHAILNTPSITAVQDKTYKGASCVVEYAGRVFFSGFNGDTIQGDKRSPNLTNYVAFSQLVKTPDDIFKCYQEGDPTSRDGSDIVDTDGGTIRISGASKVVGMKYLGNNLIVLADNGVWAISGGSDYGFTATNYKVTQITSFGCANPNTILLQGDSVMYWGDGGIYSVSMDKLGALGVNNITESTIQKLYNSISDNSRKNAYGIYDENTKKARWIFKEGNLFTSDSVTKELILDFVLGNFTLNRIGKSPNNDTEIVRPIISGDKIMYITLTGDTEPGLRRFTFSEYRDEQFLDWVSLDGVGTDAKAFMLTGSQIAGDSAVHKQIPYVVMHFEKTETDTDAEAVPNNQSSCLVRFYWDWANNSNSNKLTPLQQAYKYRKALFADPNSEYDNGFEVVTSRLKVRGRGRSFAMYIETEPKKDCHVLGWNLTLNGDPVA